MSLATICLARRGLCAIHSPLDYWKQRETSIKEDSDLIDTINRHKDAISDVTGFPLHPLSVFGNVTLDEHGRFVNADSVILTVFLHQSGTTNADRVFEAIWRRATEQSNLGLVDMPQQLRLDGWYTQTKALAHMIQYKHVPWYMMLIAVDIATLENVFVLSNAILHAGCDMNVKERICQGWHNVGVPMTATLVAELIILSIGSAIDNPLIQEFCLFAKTLLLVEYFFQLTFFTAILAIDIKRVELADLANGGVSKHLREISNDSAKGDHSADRYPTQNNADENEYKSCVECKSLKTHRAWNALVVCFIILTLSLFRLKVEYFQKPGALPSDSIPSKTVSGNLLSISSHFWDTINPTHNIQLLQIQSPYLIVFSEDVEQSFTQLELYGRGYEMKAFALNNDQTFDEPQSQPSSRFRSFLYTVLQRILLILIHLNVPCIMISCALVGIIIWITPSWREQWLLPLLKRNFVHFTLTWLLLLTQLLPCTSKFLDPRIIAELEAYNQPDIHLGAISAQKQFNKGQRKIVTEKKNVCVKTLSGKHAADVNRIATNPKHSTLMSSSQDGRIILWDMEKAHWMMRLDEVTQVKNEKLKCQKNMEYYHGPVAKTNGVSRAKRMPSARCAQIEQGNQWIVAGSDDGIVRVWNICTGSLVHELDAREEIPAVIQSELDQDKSGIRKRHGRKREQSATQRGLADRVTAVQFIGAPNTSCQPMATETASQRRFSGAKSSQTCIVVVYKSGMIREWDIISGTCINAFASGHIKDITMLHVAECESPYRKTGVSLVFTASKDGTVKCWERKMERTMWDDFAISGSISTTWTNTYIIDGHDGHSITSIDAALPVGGMGVLVTGSSDGAVKVWNLDNGDLVCVLSAGGIKKDIPVVHIGGPLLRFSKLSAEPINADMNREQRYQYNTPSDLPNPSQASDHLGPISQVVVKRYCENETGRGLCRGCDTCFGNGFMVASCSTDDMVHVWRLERCDDSQKGRCALCSKDYHRKKYRRMRKKNIGVADIDGVAAAENTSTNIPTSRRIPRHVHPSRYATDETSDNIVDIEQLAQDDNDKIALSPSFLGQIEQISGRGIVFFGDMFLAGVRQKWQRSDQMKLSGGWEAWFTHLKYYDPSSAHEDGAPNDTFSIPVETVDLEADSPVQSSTTKSPLNSQRKSWFGLSTTEKSRERLAQNNDRQWGRGRYTPMTISDDEDEDEANELLPFSTVRHVMSLGNGLGCDYGNFIKLIYIDDKKQAPLSSNLCTCKDQYAEDGSQACYCNKDTDKVLECCGGRGKHREPALKRQVKLPYEIRGMTNNFY
ncbi:hypothetical protein DFQ28_011344 [Apophysomyces sp. BC1034]|nr:hypothetical protein DFQ30_003138 [Apophysomyces sp. BC1015]KAG0181205.1 hypothetical protein DFQ29_009076 [Apophysomyces sp. BC1021]KAG0191662.1 hypothetical protein DFQ28_011344 [Apophysomyces sp. BC1034]